MDALLALTCGGPRCSATMYRHAQKAYNKIAADRYTAAMVCRNLFRYSFLAVLGKSFARTMSTLPPCDLTGRVLDDAHYERVRHIAGIARNALESSTLAIGSVYVADQAHLEWLQL